MNQQRTWNNGTVKTGAEFQEGPLQGWYPSRQRVLSRTHLPRCCFPGEHVTENKGSIPVCHDHLQDKCPHGMLYEYQHLGSGSNDGSRSYVCHKFLKGRCTYGAACKFQHSEADKICRFKSYANENIGNVAIAGPSQYDRGTMVNDLRSGPFPSESRSISLCRKFQNGRCCHGAACPYLHSQNNEYVKPRSDCGSRLQLEVSRSPGNPGVAQRNKENCTWTLKEYDEANKVNYLRTRSLPRGPRSISPRHQYLNEKYVGEASCPCLHTAMSDRPRYDSGGRQHRKLATTSSDPDFCEGSRGFTLGRSKQHGKFKSHAVQLSENTLAGGYLYEDNKNVFEQGKTYCMKGNMQLNYSQASMDITSRSRSSEGQRSRSQHNFCSDDTRFGFCRKFSRGKCYRGDSCKYLHDSCEYAGPSSGWSDKPNLGASTASRHSGVSRQFASSVMHQGRAHVRDHNIAFSEHNHAESGLKSQGGSFDVKNLTQTAYDTALENIDGQQKETPVRNHRKREISGGVAAGDSVISEADDNINSSNLTFKSQRRLCRSLTPTRGTLGHKSIRRNDLQDNYPRDSCREVALSQHPSQGPYQCSSPIDHIGDSSHLKVVAASVASSSEEVDRDSNVMKTDDPKRVTSHGMQQDQFMGSCLDSNTEIKCESELAMGAITVSHVKKENNNSKAAAFSTTISKNPDATEAQGCDKVLSHGMPLDHCVVGSLDSNTTILNQKSEAECVKGDAETSHEKHDGKTLMTGSCGIDISVGRDAINPVYEKKHVFPVDSNVSDLTKDSNGDVNKKMSPVGKENNNGKDVANDNSCPEGSEKTEASISNSRKKIKRRHSKRHAEPLKEEGIDPATKDPLSDLTKDSNGDVNNKMSPDGKENECSKDAANHNSCPEGSEKTEASISNSRKKRKRRRSKRRAEPVKEEGIDPATKVYLTKDSNGDVNNKMSPDRKENEYSKDVANDNSCPEGSEKTEASISNSRKKRKRRRSKHRVDPVKEEGIDPATKDPLSSAGETSLSHSNTLSLSGISCDIKCSTDNSYVGNLLTIDHPIQQHDQKNVGVEKILSNIESALAVSKNGHNHVGDSDCHVMQTSGSSTLEANLNSNRKLLVLDLNGLLADISGDFSRLVRKPDKMVSKKGVFKRPFCDDFLEFCFERFDVGVWSSRVRKNAANVVNFLMGNTKKRLLFCWDQSHCTATGYNAPDKYWKPLVLKELRKLWEKKEADLPWEKGYYNATNTVLLDDSPYKALRNPPYTAIFPYPYTYEDAEDKSLGPGGDLREYLERLAAADNVQKFIQENPFGQEPITKSNEDWPFYARILRIKAKQVKGNS